MPNQTALVDTSVSIDHLRGRQSAAASTQAGWLQNDPDRILVNEVVVTELLRGVSSEADGARLQGAFDKLLQADPIGRTDWLLSARIYRTCRAARLTIRSPMGCLIVADAIRLKVPALAIDRNFEAIASFTPLRLYTQQTQ